MNATIYTLQNPYLLTNLAAGQLPAVAIFFGITYFVLRQYVKIKLRKPVELTYLVAVTLTLALLVQRLQLNQVGEGVVLLVQLVLSVVSCAALYYQEWRHQQNLASSSETAVQPFQPETQALRHIPEPQVAMEEAPIDDIAKPQFSEKSSTTSSGKQGMSWAYRLINIGIAGSALVVVLLLSWPTSKGMWGKPNFIVEDGGEYGYKEMKKGATNQPLNFFRYAGIHDGKHQAYVLNQSGEISYALECAEPCKAIKKIGVGFYEKLIAEGVGKEFFPADSDSIEARVMEDAVNGRLRVYGLNEVALKFNKVQIEPDMIGVPIGPVFTENGVVFQYLGQQPAKPDNSVKPQTKSQ